jgi:hypothetical protein
MLRAHWRGTPLNGWRMIASLARLYGKPQHTMWAQVQSIWARPTRQNQ